MPLAFMKVYLGGFLLLTLLNMSGFVIFLWNNYINAFVLILYKFVELYMI